MSSRPMGRRCFTWQCTLTGPKKVTVPQARHPRMYLERSVEEGSVELQERAELSGCHTRVMCWSRHLRRLRAVFGEDSHTVHPGVFAEPYE
jgi:hypothetical protein